MSQLSLFPIPEPRLTQCSLFLAIFPDARSARGIGELGAKLRDKHGLSGRLRPLDHLHVSLHCLGDELDELDRMIQMADRACKAVAHVMPAFEVTFDRVLSFRGRISNQPLVLVGSKDGNAQLREFQRLLGAKLWKRPDRGNVNLKFTPHVTLLYDRQIAEEPIDPVSWKVNEIVLVRSHVGATKYDQLAFWTLGT